MADTVQLEPPTKCTTCLLRREPRGGGLGYCAASGNSLPGCRPNSEDMKLKDGCQNHAAKGA